MVDTMTEEEWQRQLVLNYLEDWERENLSWEEQVELAIDRDDEMVEQMKLDMLVDKEGM